MTTSSTAPVLGCLVPGFTLQQLLHQQIFGRFPPSTSSANLLPLLLLWQKRKGTILAVKPSVSFLTSSPLLVYNYQDVSHPNDMPAFKHCLLLHKRYFGLEVKIQDIKVLKSTLRAALYSTHCLDRQEMFTTGSVSDNPRHRLFTNYSLLCNSNPVPTLQGPPQVA